MRMALGITSRVSDVASAALNFPSGAVFGESSPAPVETVNVVSLGIEAVGAAEATRNSTPVDADDALSHFAQFRTSEWHVPVNIRPPSFETLLGIRRSSSTTKPANS